MRIGLIGLGIVGNATLEMLLKSGHKEFAFYDPRVDKLDSMEGCDVIFISVPVPTNRNGEQDLLILQEALGRCPAGVDVFIRSSVLPGTAQEQGMYFNDIQLYSLPEFLTERVANEDALKLPLICSEDGHAILAPLLKKKKFIVVSDEESCEFAKYIHNGFCAVKVGFFNLIQQISEEKRIKYRESVDAACEVTGFIEKTHTFVPGPDGRFGFGGKCLPKDLFALSRFAEETLGKDTFLNEVLAENFLNRFEALFLY